MDQSDHIYIQNKIEKMQSSLFLLIKNSKNFEKNADIIEKILNLTDNYNRLISIWYKNINTEDNSQFIKNFIQKILECNTIVTEFLNRELIKTEVEIKSNRDSWKKIKNYYA